MQCLNAECLTQTANADDIIAKYTGSYSKGESLMANTRRCSENISRVADNIKRRLVLDCWLEICMTPPVAAQSSYAQRMEGQGYGVRHSQFSNVVLYKDSVIKLLNVAEKTGAKFPASWETNAPQSCLAHCIQTRPHAIDRIIIQRGTKLEEIVWEEYSAGISSLIGLRPGQPRYLAANQDVALKLQKILGAEGDHNEVISAFTSSWRGVTPPRLNIHSGLIVAVPRDPTSGQDTLRQSSEDIPVMQEVLDKFPILESKIKALPLSSLLRCGSQITTTSWANLRYGYIMSMIDPNASEVSIPAAALFERTGTQHKDSARMIDKFRRQGRINLADDVQRLTDNRVFFRDSKVMARETAGEYQLQHSAGTTIISNFKLHLKSNVMFDDRGEAYCVGSMSCGNINIEVAFPHNLLQDRVNALQEELQRQFSAAGKSVTSTNLPTIIHNTHFRKYVIPHLKLQASEGDLTKGIDRLGWSADRKAYTLPGSIVTIDGRTDLSSIICPSVTALRMFSIVENWAETAPKEVHKNCHELIAMILATCVRYFKRCRTIPINVAQSSDAMELLEALMKGMGQKQVYEANQNGRTGQDPLQGLHGYPTLCAGPSMMLQGSAVTPVVRLTDAGYSVPYGASSADYEEASRALQYALGRVVEWCIATGADSFREVRSIDGHRTLIQEGQWLLENVCDLQPWEVDVKDFSAIEAVFAAIPFDKTVEHVTLVNGDSLTVDLRDIPHDRDKILMESKALGSLMAIRDETLHASAVKLLPAIENFYGQRPELNIAI